MYLLALKDFLKNFRPPLFYRSHRIFYRSKNFRPPLFYRSKIFSGICCQYMSVQSEWIADSGVCRAAICSDVRFYLILANLHSRRCLDPYYFTGLIVQYVNSYVPACVLDSLKITWPRPLTGPTRRPVRNRRSPSPLRGRCSYTVGKQGTTLLLAPNVNRTLCRFLHVKALNTFKTTHCVSQSRKT